MGLIKMFTSAVGSTFADQVVEYFRCEDMSTKILCQPATLVKRGKTVNNGTEGVISNGSRFDVAVNQAVQDLYAQDIRHREQKHLNR